MKRINTVVLGACERTRSAVQAAELARVTSGADPWPLVVKLARYAAKGWEEVAEVASHQKVRRTRDGATHVRLSGRHVGVR